MRRDARRIPAFFDSRLNCAAGASLGFAVIETILEWDRFLANGHGNLRLLVSVAWYAYAFVALCIWASREGTQELGAMDFANPLCDDSSRIVGVWSDFDRGDFARCSVLPRSCGIVSDLHGNARPWFDRSATQPRS